MKKYIAFLLLLLLVLFGCSKSGSSCDDLLETTFESIKQNDPDAFAKVYFDAEDVDFFAEQFKRSFEFQNFDEFEKQAVLEQFEKQKNSQAYAVRTLLASILQQAKAYNIDWSQASFLRSEVGKKVQDAGMPLGLTILENAWIAFAVSKDHYSLKFEGIMKTNRGYVITGSDVKLTKD